MVNFYGDAFSCAELIAWIKMKNRALKFPKLTNISGNTILFKNEEYQINLMEPLYERYKELRKQVSNLIVNLYYLNDPKKIIFFVGFDYYDKDLLNSMNLSSTKFNPDKYTQVDRSLCKIKKVNNCRTIEFNVGRVSTHYYVSLGLPNSTTIENEIEYFNSEHFLQKILHDIRDKIDFSNEMHRKYYQDTEQAVKEKKFWIRIWPNTIDIMQIAKTSIDWQERYSIVEPYMDKKTHVVDFSLISQEDIDKIYVRNKKNDKLIRIDNEIFLYID